MTLTWPAYLAAFAGSLTVAWVLTPLLLRLAISRRVLDAPDVRKSQTSPVPYLGGVAIIAGFSAMCLAAAAVSRAAPVVLELGLLLGLGLALGLLGLADDLRGGISPKLRLLVEAAAGAVVWATGSGTQLQAGGAVDLVVTVLWVVGITNAFNLLDNMDGLSAGVATIAALSFSAIAALNGQFLVAALSSGVAGCACGFLRHNFHPAKIYMGDAGSLFLGFLLAVLGLKITLTDTPARVALFVPLFVLGVALFDTTLVTWQRLAHRRSPFQGGRDHASHRLVWVGIPVPVAVCLIYAAAVSLGWLALLLTRLDVTSGFMLISFTLTVGALAMTLLASVPVYENSRQRRAMLQVVRTHQPEPAAPTATAEDSSSAADSPALRTRHSDAS